MVAKRIKNKYRQKGYTLIELLLVVAVLAFIAALGVKTYRDKAASDRINIAALNLQHVLEAGIAYNTNNAGYWPKKNWSNSTCTSTPDDAVFVQNYLPNNNNLSNFGVPICWSGEDPVQGDQKAKRFWVAVSTGDSGNTTAVSNAQRIAARLPNAIITNDPNDEPSGTPANTCKSGACYVKAVVAMPGGSASGGSYVSGVGNCDSNVNAVDAQSQPLKQGGSGTNVYCRRTTLSEEFCATFSGACGDTALNSLSQYEIGFQCKPGEIPNVYAVPNFVRMDRFLGDSVNPPQAQTSVSGILELSGAPEINPYLGKPADYVDYHNYCQPTLADGTVTCKVTMVATTGDQNGSPVITMGCTEHMQSLGVCKCIDKKTDGSGHQGGGCVDSQDGGNQPQHGGAIGASYIAMCNPSHSTTSVSAANQKKNIYW